MDTVACIKSTGILVETLLFHGVSDSLMALDYKVFKNGPSMGSESQPPSPGLARQKRPLLQICLLERGVCRRLDRVPRMPEGAPGSVQIGKALS
jgi:hypothetical protein